MTLTTGDGSPIDLPTDAAAGQGSVSDEAGVADGAPACLSSERESPPDSRIATWWRHAVDLGEAIVDHANPILVKETRQALKSRQFSVTFLVVLIACWAASFGTIAIVGPEIKYGAYGAVMFNWFYTILNFALLIVVPFSAFRSLCAEKEDNTYDLLSISTLSAQQIITGKLCSAALQLTIYLSGAAPFVAFSLLLRGIEPVTVGTLLAASVLLSLFLSVVGLLAGTVGHARSAQALMSIVLVITLLMCFVSSINVAFAFLTFGQSIIRDREFWISVAALLTFGATTFALIHASAAAQISFTTENRSTPIRIRLLIQQAFFVGWLVVLAEVESRKNYDTFGQLLSMALFVGCIIAAVYWYIMGIFLTGEWPHLSRRVQRSLPQTSVGRALLTWFNPGPGTGYVFATANLATFVALTLVAISFAPPPTPIASESIACASLLAWFYVVGYLGWARLAINFVRRFAFVSMAAAVLLNLIFLLAGVGTPMVIEALSTGNQAFRGWSLLHLTNPAWTIFELIDSGFVAIDGELTLLVVGSLACAAFLLNIRSIAAEVRRHRIAAPQAVVDDDAQLRAAVVSGPKNPWDVDG